MLQLVASAVFFIVLHRGVSGTALRSMIIRRTGERAYLMLFNVVSVGALIWLGYAYANAADGAALMAEPPAVFVWSQFIVQPVAIFLILAGLTMPNPGTVKMESVIERHDVVQGVLRVTRHPFLWGVALLALGHLLVTPSLRAIILFGTLALVALSGTRSIDAKRRKSLGPKWEAFEAQTSNVPFVAVLDGRQPLRVAEVGWWRPLAALLLAAASIAAHPGLR